MLPARRHDGSDSRFGCLGSESRTRGYSSHLIPAAFVIQAAWFSLFVGRQAFDRNGNLPGSQADDQWENPGQRSSRAIGSLGDRG